MAKFSKKKNENTSTSHKVREAIIRKSYALTQTDVDCIEEIKDKCLNKKIVLSDSHVIRMALRLTVELSEKELIEAARQTPKNPTGRPKKIN